jgi:hypothetical protein
MELPNHCLYLRKCGARELVADWKRAGLVYIFPKKHK